ncbi:hypothetical protein VNO80_05953 [Phaseolus coccineus]|uniref:Glycine-rich protein n=1 Tax=Phaseolus coccineus TaxID=3886 RepID=A0AAN9NKZ1_PHACN
MSTLRQHLRRRSQLLPLSLLYIDYAFSLIFSSIHTKHISFQLICYYNMPSKRKISLLISTLFAIFLFLSSDVAARELKEISGRDRRAFSGDNGFYGGGGYFGPFRGPFGGSYGGGFGYPFYGRYGPGGFGNFPGGGGFGNFPGGGGFGNFPGGGGFGNFPGGGGFGNFPGGGGFGNFPGVTGGLPTNPVGGRLP